MARGIYCIFCQKNAFLRQKMTFFGQNHFIQKSSVTKNTSFKHVRNNTFLPKLWYSNFHQILPMYVQLLPRSLQECMTIAVGPRDLSRGCQSYLLRSQKTGIRNEWKDAITIGGWRIITEQNNNTFSFLAMFQAKMFSSRV